MVVDCHAEGGETPRDAGHDDDEYLGEKHCDGLPLLSWLVFVLCSWD